MKKVVAFWTEGFVDLTEGKAYEVAAETESTVIILDDANEEHEYPKAIFYYEN